MKIPKLGDKLYRVENSIEISVWKVLRVEEKEEDEQNGRVWVNRCAHLKGSSNIISEEEKVKEWFIMFHEINIHHYYHYSIEELISHKRKIHLKLTDEVIELVKGISDISIQLNKLEKIKEI